MFSEWLETRYRIRVNKYGIEVVDDTKFEQFVSLLLARMVLS